MSKPTDAPVLYSFRRCPYAIRARMALLAAGIDVDIREVALGSKPDALRAISAKATVPVLQLADGQVIEESLDIMMWALRQHDPHGWLTQGDDEAKAQWLERNDRDFKPLLDRYKYATRHPGQTQDGHRESAMNAFVGPLDAALVAQAYLSGERACCADVALFPFVRQFSMVQPQWFANSGLTGLQRWLDDWLASPWFVAAMVKRPLWREPALAIDKARRAVD